MSDPLALLAAVCLGIYLLAIVWFLSGTWRRPTGGHLTPSVSVVIAARDEAQTIEACLQALLAQRYPGERFEVILIDDGSVDETYQRAQGLGRADPVLDSATPRLRILSTQETLGVSGSKKAALSLGIAAAKGDIILTTDADCRVPEDWLATLAGHFSDDVDAVVGFSQVIGTGALAGFEGLDFLLLMSAACGACGQGHPVAASGQSFAFRKSAFDAIGGYASIRHRVSGDDVLLLQLLRRTGNRIVFAAQPAAFVEHPATRSIGALLNQRIRWASNGPVQLRLDPVLFIHLCATLLSAFGVVVLVVLALAGMIEPLYAVSYWAIKIVGDALLALRGAQLFGRRDLLWYFPLWSILHPLYIVTAGVLGLAGIFRWKGATVRWGRVPEGGRKSVES